MTDPNSPIVDFYPTDFEVDMNGKRFAWQGIAKLPFIDEERLLAEEAKIEHTLTEDEARRNSMMPDMLFIALSHKLSPYIFSLDSRCKQLPNKERIEVKEIIDPFASGGMNGYISLCAGDPCPTIFRSPIQGMDDIMDNQVICAIFKLPDYHKHIAQPPAGVKPPKKTVNMDDLQPEPALWHEDSGKKPWENGRHEHNRHHNPHGVVSGRQLADAAQRLVVNNLQVKRDRNVNYHHVHSPHPQGPYNHDPIVTVQPRSVYLPHYHRDHGNRYYGQSFASSRNQYNRLNTQRGQHGFSHGGVRYTHGYRQPAVHHNRDLHLIQTPQHYYLQHGGGYNYIPSYYQYDGSTNHYQSHTTGWAPRGNTGTGRGHVSQRYQPYRR